MSRSATSKKPISKVWNCRRYRETTKGDEIAMTEQELREKISNLVAEFYKIVAVTIFVLFLSIEC